MVNERKTKKTIFRIIQIINLVSKKYEYIETNHGRLLGSKEYFDNI